MGLLFFFVKDEFLAPSKGSTKTKIMIIHLKEFLIKLPSQIGYTFFVSFFKRYLLSVMDQVFFLF